MGLIGAQKEGLSVWEMAGEQVVYAVLRKRVWVAAWRVIRERCC